MAENVTKTSRVRRLTAGATAVVHRGARTVLAAEPEQAPPAPDARPKPAPPRPTPPPKPTDSPKPDSPTPDAAPAAGTTATSTPATRLAATPPGHVAAATPKPARTATPAAARRSTASRKPGAPGKSTTKAPDPKAANNGSGAPLIVRPGENPWTAVELAAVRSELDAEVLRHEEEITDSERDLAELLRDSGEGAGEDPADSGTKTFEREHEMSLANNSRDMLQQSFRARARMDDGTYGICETCAQPIGKARLQAFPRATLCVICKQREERR